MRFRKYLLFVGLGLILALSAGCATTSSQSKGEQPDRYPTPTFFEQIPADTPYVLTRFEVWDQPPFEENVWGFAGGDGMKMSGGVTESEIAQELLKRIQNADDLKRFHKKIGLEYKGFEACYGVGLYPVCRLAVNDQSAFAEFLDNVEDESGVSSIRKERFNKKYRVYRHQGGDTVVRITEKTLWIGFSPSKSGREIVRDHVVGETKVKKSIADTGQLHKVAKKYGYTPYGIGYLDSGKLLEKLRESNQSGPLSKHCKKEIGQLTDRFSGLAMGVADAEEDSLTSEFTFEINDRRKNFGNVKHPYPAYQPQLKKGYLAEMGLGLDVKKFFDVSHGWAEHIIEVPYRCEDLQGLNSAANNYLKVQPPASVKSLRGAYIGLKDIDIENRSLEGILIIQTTEPGRLLGQLEMAVPALSGLSVPEKGEPVKIEALEKMVPSVKAPHIAMHENALGISFGKGMQKRLSAHLKESKERQTPVASISYDSLAMAQLAAGVMRRGGFDVSGTNWFEHIPGPAGVHLDLDKHGVQIRVRQTFSESNVEDEVVRRSSD
jgi:hypothetical protein